jgi:hypothetical protein
MSRLQRGNRPSDAQAVVFAHGQFVNVTLMQNRHGRRLKTCNEGQAYEGWIAMGRGKSKRNSISKSESERWKKARLMKCCHLQLLNPVESMCITIGKAVNLPQERC